MSRSLNAARNRCSEPTSVVGMLHQKTPGVPDEEDYQMMSLDFSRSEDAASTIIAQISCGRYMPPAWQEAIAFRPPAALQVACERGIAYVDFPATLVWFDGAGRHVETLGSERPVGETLLLQFHRNVTSLVLKSASLDDAYRALTIVLAARQSHAEGRRVPIDP